MNFITKQNFDDVVGVAECVMESSAVLVSERLLISNINEMESCGLSEESKHGDMDECGYTLVCWVERDREKDTKNILDGLRNLGYTVEGI